MDGSVTILLFAAIALLVVLSIIWHVSRSRSMLEAWAEREGFRLLSAERRFLRRGPFFWFTSKGQEVFYVTVEDPAGEVRSGYVRVGGFLFGLLTERVDVRWDE